MRRHYESLNYMDGDPRSAVCTFTRTAGSEDGYISVRGAWKADTQVNESQRSMTRDRVIALRDMLNEVLEDWK